MDQRSLEDRLARAEVAPIFVDSRLLRRIIKRDRGVPGLGLEVPHARCYAIRRDALLRIASAAELGRAPGALPEDVVLLPRLTEGERRSGSAKELLVQVWRAAFHAAVHVEIERRIEQGALSAAMIRERIHRIGETEFDEARLVLRHDDHLLPPYDDRETFTEFAALYLELRHFAPAHLDRMFPTLRDRGRVEAAIDVDAAPLLARTRPEGAEAVPAPHARGAAGSPEPEPSSPPVEEKRPPSAAETARLLVAAERARRDGNDVRAALLGLAAHAVAPAEQEAGVLDGVRADLDSLAARLDRALCLDRSAAADVALARWSPWLLTLARAGFRRRLRHTLEARLLFDLQSAAVARERPASAVDLVEYALSFGRRPVVRPLPMVAEVRIAHRLHEASSKVRRARLDAEARRSLAELVRQATLRAEENVRSTLRPPILGALDAVGLVPRDAAERVARAKLTEELLDQAVHHGFFAIGHLRDALSRNQLKLSSLSGPGELFHGDPLLLLDRRLAVSIDGVYHRGEFYLRSLQRVSSVAFGTGPGRFLTRYLFLPVGASAVLLEGLSHLLALIMRWLGYPPIHLLNKISLPAVSLFAFALLHSATFRAASLRALSGVRWALTAVFVRFPLFVAHLPIVRATLRSRGVRGVLRYLVKPLAITVVPWLVARVYLSRLASFGLAAALFAALEIALISPAGVLIEEVTVDWVARRFRTLKRQVLPGLFRQIEGFFRSMTDLVERAVYTVDEWLRFHKGQSFPALAAKATIGLIWFFVAYLIRFCVNLLIEPQINPIKHFPVVTVSHKIVISLGKDTIIPALHAALDSHIGATTVTAIAAPTLLVIPGIFGFLVWELKENWRLYRETRSPHLRPAAIGHHGETMGALMKPGFHSGTLPKLYKKLRRAAHGGGASLDTHEDALREVEEAVHHFAARELVAPLSGARRFRGGEVRVDGVELGSNRITLVLGCTGAAESAGKEGSATAEAGPKQACRIAFEEQSGLLLASIPDPGWLAELGDEDRRIAENAIAGFYQLAGVDVVREQLEAALSAGAESVPPYDIGDAGLVVWRAAASSRSGEGSAAGQEYGSEVVYDFGRGVLLKPVTRGEPPAEEPPVLDARLILYRSQTISWADWVAAWTAASAPEGDIPRVLDGASILPRRHAGAGYRAA